MPAPTPPDRSLRELLSAAAVEPSLRRRLKARASAVLADWGVRAPGRRVYFVEPGEAPPLGDPDEVFIELPPRSSAPALDDPDLEAVAGGWEAARERAARVVDHALDAAAWRSSDPWG